MRMKEEQKKDVKKQTRRFLFLKVMEPKYLMWIQPVAVEEKKGLSRDLLNIPPISAEDEIYESASSSDGCFSNGGRSKIPLIIMC
ncbi:hypothetical protein TNCV_759081 [Trichonephila clavipes]|nr:hypothetical protein TNCV_759081 [Trichonephila clavipes]